MNDIQRRLTYNTCLICGIRTSQLVNIFEEGRGGPNLVDVIYEKYNIKAENDTEKFLCYSCNNWLINWWSLQHKNDQGNNQAHSSSNSPSKSERNRNEKRYTTNKTTDQKENEQRRRPNFPLERVVGRSAGNNRQVLADLAHQNAEVVSSTTNDDDDDNTFELKRRQKPYAKKYKCSYCKSRFATAALRQEHLRHVHDENENARKYILMPSDSTEDEDMTTSALVDANIVEMLRKQGTLITLESSSSRNRKPRPPKCTSSGISSNTITKNHNNEILLAFDRVITEAIMANLDTYLLSTQENTGLLVSP
ncbi:protein phyllopod [Culicoides brevitarsis]|uniref:protein phyllopod n=1 Tax=Culicoides brevitarsis TaxID=469753 RepID=UPI00307BE2E8